MKKIIASGLAGIILAGITQAGFAADSGQKSLAAQFKEVHGKSTLFDFMQRYYVTSPETARALKASMDAEQLNAINQSLHLISRQLQLLLDMEVSRAEAELSQKIKKG